MTQPIQVKNRTYRHFFEMVPNYQGPAEDRNFLSPDKTKADLSRSHGIYVPVAGRNILFVIDEASAKPGSDEWRFIREVAGALAIRAPNLNAAGKEALKHLDAVVFARGPSRSFASVKKATFFYDTDEFRRSDGSLIRAEYAASNIVHDANHVRLYKARKPYAGDAAEIECWRLQVDNKDALGLDETETKHLRKLIDDPGSSKSRMDSDPFKD